MAETVAHIKADVLLRLHGFDGDPYEVATMEIPLLSETMADGRVKTWIDTSVLAELGPALAEAFRAAQRD